MGAAAAPCGVSAHSPLHMSTALWCSTLCAACMRLNPWTCQRSGSTFSPAQAAETTGPVLACSAFMQPVTGDFDYQVQAGLLCHLANCSLPPTLRCSHAAACAAQTASCRRAILPTPSPQPSHCHARTRCQVCRVWQCVAMCGNDLRGGACSCGWIKQLWGMPGACMSLVVHFFSYQVQHPTVTPPLPLPCPLCPLPGMQRCS